MDKINNKLIVANMKSVLFYISIIFLILVFWGCVAGITRQETDIYTLSNRDTTTLFFMQNAPGNRDNGIIYPSSRAFKSERYLMQKDSIVDRFYPNFIRLGAFESVGLLLGGESQYAAGTGMFGIFPEFGIELDSNRGSSDFLFKGGIYRFGIGEWRLRWFRDAANWTIGTSLWEIIASDARYEKTLMSVAPLYVRKRWYLREEIPYVALTTHFGLGYWPSQYVNVSGSLDAGSIAGLNLRAYLGLAIGYNSNTTNQVKQSGYTEEAQTIITPYAGLGISFLDFLNIVPETETEWKDHQHSGWDIGLLQFGLISSNADTSVFATSTVDSLTNDTTTTELFIRGMIVRLANADISLPVLGYRVYAGTSLFNYVILGKSQWGAGILPIRFGLWQTLIPDELSINPFIEFSYYPSTMFNAGGRLSLRLTEQINVSLIAGYISGKTKSDLKFILFSEQNDSVEFSNIYFGVSVGLLDKIFFPENLRYNR